MYQDEKEKQIAHEIIDNVNKSKVYSNPIVTEVAQLDEFFTAEDKHQNFYNANP